MQPRRYESEQEEVWISGMVVSRRGGRLTGEYETSPPPSEAIVRNAEAGSRAQAYDRRRL